MSRIGLESDPRIRETLAALEDERATNTTEIGPWKAFGRRLGKIAASRSSPRQVTKQGGLMTQRAQGSFGGDARIQEAVETAFEQTVFSTDAVDDLESDPYALMRAELGPEIAATVYESPPPPTFVTELREAVESVLANRRRVIDLIDREERSIDDCWSRIEPVREELDSYQAVCPEVSAKGLFVYHERLGELLDQCATIATTRQESLHSSNGALDNVTVAEYLYEECSVAYPVLSVVTTTIRDIEDLRGDIRRDIARLDDDPRSHPS